MLQYLSFYDTISIMGSKSEELHTRIRRMRKGANLRQDEVATRLHVNRMAIVSMEAGRRKVSTDELLLLCDLFHCSADDLLTGGHKEENTPFMRTFLSLNKSDRKEVMELMEFKLQRRRAVL